MALLAVLFIVMAVTLISLGFVARSDRELACAANLSVRMQMDYMAETGLKHAEAFIVNPQSVDTVAVGYWQGGTGLQIAAGSDYYDISVVRDTSDATDHCSYTITSQAYRLNGVQKISKSSLTASLRLDPCVALWVGDTYASEIQMTVNGDIYCGNDLGGIADINGDAFAAGIIAASYIEGDENAGVASTDRPVEFPNIVIDTIKSQYMVGSSTYSVGQLSGDILSNTVLGPTMNNPAGIYYRNGNLKLDGSVKVYGTLLVRDDLQVKDSSNVVIAQKNYPAIVVGRDLNVREFGQLTVEGLVQVDDEIQIESNCVNSYLTVTGGVFIKTHNIDITGGAGTDIQMVFTAAPEKTALEYKMTDGTSKRWTSVGGTFYKKISR